MDGPGVEKEVHGLHKVLNRDVIIAENKALEKVPR